MKKLVLLTLSITLVFITLFFATPTRIIGTGILLDSGGRLMTLSHLVDNAKDIIIKFPNADNIEANIIKKTIPKFLSILKLKTPPKIERGLMFFSDSIQIKKGDYLFALFYPIANTQEDKHILREGSILSKSGPNGEDEFFEINFPIKSGEGGTAIFDSKREIIGIALSPQDIKKILGSDSNISNSSGYGLKISSIRGLKGIVGKKSFRSHAPMQKKVDLSKGLSYFIEGIQKNIILIETAT